MHNIVILVHDPRGRPDGRRAVVARCGALRYGAPMRDLEAMSARMVCVGFDGPAVSDDLRRLIARGVSTVILFTRNYQDARQVGELCGEIKALARRPILIGVDQEGGRVQRFRGSGFSPIPSLREVGARGDEREAFEIGRVLARELRSVGVDLDFAPVLDVDSNPANPVIGERSFGADPHLVARMGCAMIAGLQGGDGAQRGVAACGKHFPGHGDTSVDSHVALPRLPHDMARLEQVELVPFRAAVAGGVSAIMTSHVLFEAIDASRPATMSQLVIGGLLRDSLNFDGVIFSDDLEMKAVLDHWGADETVTQAAIAGVDVMCVCSRPELQARAIDAIIGGVRDGIIPGQRLTDANRRLDALMTRFAQR